MGTFQVHGLSTEMSTSTSGAQSGPGGALSISPRGLGGTVAEVGAEEGLDTPGSTQRIFPALHHVVPSKMSESPSHRRVAAQETPSFTRNEMTFTVNEKTSPDKMDIPSSRSGRSRERDQSINTLASCPMMKRRTSGVDLDSVLIARI